MKRAWLAAALVPYATFSLTACTATPYAGVTEVPNATKWPVGASKVWSGINSLLARDPPPLSKSGVEEAFEVTLHPTRNPQSMGQIYGARTDPPFSVDLEFFSNGKGYAVLTLVFSNDDWKIDHSRHVMALVSHLQSQGWSKPLRETHPFEIMSLEKGSQVLRIKHTGERIERMDIFN